MAVAAIERLHTVAKAVESAPASMIAESIEQLKLLTEVRPFVQGRGRRNPHRGGKRRTTGAYEGSSIAKRATRRGGNPAARAYA